MTVFLILLALVLWIALAIERVVEQRRTTRGDDDDIYRALNQDRLLGINEAPANGPLLSAIREAQANEKPVKCSRRHTKAEWQELIAKVRAHRASN